MEEENEVPTLDLVKVLGDHMVAEENQRDKSGRIYASELGVALGPEHDGCTLGFWLKCRNEPRRDRTPGEILMTQVGELLHDYLSEMLRKVLPQHGWEVIAVEERVKIEAHGESIGSRLDVKMRHTETGHVRVIDIKTKRGGAFKWLNEAKPGNELQVQAYIFGEDADDGGLLYVDREGQNFMRYFEVERADERPVEAIRRLKEIRDSPEPPAPVSLRLNVKENKGPDSVYLNVPWQIEWCDLKKCRCKEALPKGDVPSGVAAKLHEVKDEESTFEVRLTDDGMPWEGLIMELLEKQYPERTFVRTKPKE
jgi:hypothetical protein